MEKNDNYFDDKSESEKMRNVANMVNDIVNAKPTAQSYDVLNDLVAKAQVHYKKLDKVLTDDLFKFNNMVSDAAVPAVMIVPSEMSVER